MYLEQYEKYNSQVQTQRGLLKKAVFRHLNKKWEKKGHKSADAVYLDRIFRTIGKDTENIIEIGPGSGFFLENYSSFIKSKAVMDRDNFYQEQFEKKNVQFIHHDISKLKQLNIGVYDLVIMNHLIEHISSLDDFFYNLKQFTKTGSFIYIRTPDIKKVGHAFFDDFTHIKPFTVKSLADMFKFYGFEQIKIGHTNNTVIRIEDILNLKPGTIQSGGEIEGIFRRE